jgi:hypothetical protein
MTELNKFGKKRYKNRYANTGAVNATKSWVVPITRSEIDSYAPFNRFTIFNRDTACKIRIALDAIYLGDDTITTADRTFYIEPESGLAIEPEDNIVFQGAVVTNLDAANNIAIGDIVLMFQNY